jgi:hypothetical protein
MTVEAVVAAAPHRDLQEVEAETAIDEGGGNTTVEARAEAAAEVETGRSEAAGGMRRMTTTAALRTVTAMGRMTEGKKSAAAVTVALGAIIGATAGLVHGQDHDPALVTAAGESPRLVPEKGNETETE